MAGRFIGWGQSWCREFGGQSLGSYDNLRRRLRDAKPFEQIRMVFSISLFICGLLLLGVLVIPQYDRALVLTGRTEVLSMRLDDAAFGSLAFQNTVYRASPDQPAYEGDLQLDISPGTVVRFVRIGRDAVRLSFAAGAAGSAGSACSAGLRQVGSVDFGEAASALCDAAVVIVRLTTEPPVVGLSGGIVVGEEVSQGAGPRPLLLEATASLLVKHGSWFFRRVCSWDALENLCDRFVANSVVLSPGDSVRADERAADRHSSEGLGFIRIDPNELQSGMLFNLTAPAKAFEVQRMQGETFTVRESLFDIIEKSPVVKALNTLLVALGLVWYFLRLMSGKPGEAGAAALLVGALLCTPGPAHAQQAFLRVNEVGAGQGLLRSRGDRCYVVTPLHVLGAETSARVTAPGREQGESDSPRKIPAAPEAVALLSVHGIPLATCPPFEGAVSLDNLLLAHAGATLQLVRPDGGIDRIPLSLGSIETETLEVQSNAGRLQQGMSGGLVLVADRPAGLLFDVTDDGHTGRVARLDRVFERLTPHLANALPVEAAHASAGSVPYEIVRSNAAPVEAANKVSGLQGDGPGPWRVTAEGRVELVLKVSGPFSGVALDATGLADPPQTMEILGGRGDHGPWQTLASFSLEPGDKLLERRFPPVGLGYLLLRAYAPASRTTLALKRLVLIPK